ncbi:MAG TPA: LLM class flavin-dependent oxidoreductase [Solirubrobacterales bacterium]|nr:LLM class flavin-dependent oxidoreductase [Solirubrobacterales bacterium]
MDLGIGLPNAVPGTTGKQLTDWARAAEEAGFSTLGTIDRIVYPSYESLVALSAAAAVTERIRLATDVLLGPLRQNPSLIAKQMLSLDAVAGGGRTVLGIGAGGREDDFEVGGLSMSGRGAWLDSALEKILAIWNGEGEVESKVGPRPQDDRPTLLVGGYVQASFERAARFGDGWTQGGSGPDQFAEDAANLEEAWKRHGREGKPYKMALTYFSLGPDAEKNAQASLGSYYAYMGEEGSAMIVANALKDADSVKAAVSSFESKGCDELILFPSSPDPEQVTLLADAAGL